MTAPSRRIARGIAGLALAAATAAFVWWRNSQVADLLDLSYVLDFSFRMAHGDWPYRDYPFVHEPLTFINQAIIIALTGRHYLHHIVYAAAAGGMVTWLTWKLLQDDLRHLVPTPGLAATALAAPLVALGICSIIPHPFYDSDTTFAILLVTLAAGHAERKRFPTWRTIGAGALLVLPVLGKQNTGFAFLGAAVAGLVVLAIIERHDRTARRGYALMLGGAAAAFALTTGAIAVLVGLGNYLRWTIQFAAERRLPPLNLMLDVYRDGRMGWWFVSTLLAWAVATLMPRLMQRWHGAASHDAAGRPTRTARTLTGVAIGLLCLPFLYLLIAAIRSRDFWDYAERFLSLWPFVLVASACAALGEFRHRTGLARIWPLVLLAAVHGCLLSQQVWGSTYGIWPLFVLLLGTVLVSVARPLGALAPKALTAAAVVIGVSLSVGGWSYTTSNERLSPVDVVSGPVAGSVIPELEGLRTPGRWLPDFDELVAWTAAHVPFEDGIILLPGEDPFFYATGRMPKFPVLLFDETGNPYNPGEYLRVAKAFDIHWLVVKKLSQSRDTMYDQSFAVKELSVEFRPVANLRNYVIYRR